MIEASEKRVRLWMEKDTEMFNPREDCDNFGTMVCWHRRYNLGDEQPRDDPDEFFEKLACEANDRLEDLIYDWNNSGFEWLESKYGTGAAINASGSHISNLIRWVLDRNFLILPLYLYDHSGLSMSTGAFSCPWDSGQVGYIYVSVEDVLKNWSVSSLDEPVHYPHDDSTKPARERALDLLRIEVEVYDQYLRGDIWGFSIEEMNEDGEWVTTDSCGGFFGDDPFKNGISDHVPEELHDLLREADVEW